MLDCLCWLCVILNYQITSSCYFFYFLGIGRYLLVDEKSDKLK
ncbi:hypothetical protein LINGRAHAP2_LOCUS10429, partial [Linum grandiflorum]